MKVEYLVSCVLLSILVILLLSTVVQATEYTNITAENISKQIENGEDINYTGCRIKGNLDIKEIKLKTTPNPYFDNLMKKGLNKEENAASGLKNLSVIESNITIRNSIFEGTVDFSNVLFKRSVSFSGTKFNTSSVSFRGANFNGPASFFGTNFLRDYTNIYSESPIGPEEFTNFDYVKFNNSANFSMANFSTRASFQYVNFNEYANFSQTIFDYSADFDDADFNHFNFSETKFNQNVFFDNTKVSNYKKIKADTILEQIKNGKDVTLVNCLVLGELDINKIKLKSVPNPYFNELLYELKKEDQGGLLSYNDGKINLIESNITIINSIFVDEVDFSDVLFKNPVKFSYVNFNNFSAFSSTSFKGFADFSGTNFADCFFGDATFFGSADFGETNFHDAYFGSVSFLGPTYFENVDFYDSANFNSVNFFNSSNFFDTYFHRDVIFDSTYFYDSVDFGEAKFYKDTSFTSTCFNDSAEFEVPETSEKIITNSKNCQIFMEAYKNKVLYTDADNIYYNYRKKAQEDKDLSISKFIDILSWVTCGYGVKFSHTIDCIISILVAFSFFYWGGSRFYPSSNITEKKISRLDSVLLSIRGFTILGTGDFYSKNSFFRILVTLEGLLGWIMLGIFMATLTNVMIRL